MRTERPLCRQPCEAQKPAPLLPGQPPSAALPCAPAWHCACWLGAPAHDPSTSKCACGLYLGLCGLSSSVRAVQVLQTLPESMCAVQTARSTPLIDQSWPALHVPDWGLLLEEEVYQQLLCSHLLPFQPDSGTSHPPEGLLLQAEQQLMSSTARLGTHQGGRADEVSCLLLGFLRSLLPRQVWKQPFQKHSCPLTIGGSLHAPPHCWHPGQAWQGTCRFACARRQSSVLLHGNQHV